MTRPAMAPRVIRWAFALLLALGCGFRPAAAEEPQWPRILPQDGFNLKVVETLPSDHVVLTLTTPVHNWFAGTVTDLPTDRPVTLGMSLTGQGSGSLPADVAKWQGLRPVMTYADPTRFETYEWYTRDAEGRWVSGDPCRQGEVRFAGSGRVPVQQAIPAEVAGNFLSPDGAFWSPWCELEDAFAAPKVNIFRVTHTFAQPTATVAMRVPYTYTYLQTVLARLRAADIPGVTVDEIGETTGGRKLQIIRVTDPDDPRANAHTILVTAREHATEPAGSWVVQGMLNALLRDQTLRTGRTWLLVPILDPDGSAEAVNERITELFRKTDKPKTPIEVRLYIQYMTQYITEGGQLDIALSLHNVEANECANLYCPLVDISAMDMTEQINRLLFDNLRTKGFLLDYPSNPWYKGFLSFRFYSWCTKRYHSLGLVYEVNDRYPPHRLHLHQLAQLGETIATQLTRWTVSDIGRSFHNTNLEFLVKHRKNRKEYYLNKQHNVGSRTLHEMINLGY